MPDDLKNLIEAKIRVFDIINRNKSYKISGIISANSGQELVDKFSDWIETYWQYIDNKNNFDFEKFNKTGKQLAKELKTFLGNDYYVEFEAETDPPTRNGEEIL